MAFLELSFSLSLSLYNATPKMLNSLAGKKAFGQVLEINNESINGDNINVLQSCTLDLLKKSSDLDAKHARILLTIQSF